MPFRFQQDIISWLKLGLTDELWDDVRRQLEKVSRIEKQTNLNVEAPPVPPRKKTNPPGAQNRDSLNATKQIITDVTTKNTNLYNHQKYTNSLSKDQISDSNPLIVFEMMAGVLKTKIRSLQDICTSNQSLTIMGLETLESSLNTIFSFLLVKHQQEQNVIYPLLVVSNYFFFDKLIKY